MSNTSLTIFYDGDCPFCSNYVNYLELRNAGHDPQLVNVRQDMHARALLEDADIDLDEGMAVEINGNWYVGADAIHTLSLLTANSNSLSRLNRAIFSNKTIATLAYPLLRAGRSLTLFAMGRSQLKQESQVELAPLHLFNVSWGLFAILHVVSYAWFFKPSAPLNASTWLIGLAGLLLLLYPASKRIFAVLLGAFIIDAWLQMPVQSNHTIIKNFLLGGMCIAALRQLLTNGSFAQFYLDFAPVGRSLLVIMYIFGVIHKINSDFLNPSVSCAVSLWQEMPAPLSYLDGRAIHSAAIYGTFVIETVILVCLLLRRTRTIGISFGIGFHALLALSGYAMYAQFSMLTVALHVLFIEPSSASRLIESPLWRRLHATLRSPLGITALCIWIAVFSLLAWNGSYSQASIVWLPFVLTLAWGIIRYAGSDDEPTTALNMLASRSWLANILTLAFFFNCLTPYLGLKNAQSLNMFANLRLEDGRSNHLIFSSPPGPFRYLDDVVAIGTSSGSSYLAYAHQNDLHLTYYDLLDQLDRQPGATVTFTRNGVEWRNQNSTTLSNEINSLLHPRWFRNWFHFAPVDLRSPKPCALDR